MDQELYEQLNRISDVSEASIDQDIRSELIDAMYTTGFAFTGESENEGVHNLEFKRQDVVVKMEYKLGEEPKSEATPPDKV